MDFQGFDDRLLRFLRQLGRNNNREWFQKNKARYEAEVREPVLAFIRAMEPRIERISPHILVSDSKVAGSMMRPYRDTRFSRSKLPYKTNVGIHFRHEHGRDAHAPGFWLHIDPKEFWLAVGMWKPNAKALDKVRLHIAECPDDWLAAKDDRDFRADWEVIGDSLKRPPRGYDRDHPLIEDIKRKDFLGLRQMGIEQLRRPDLAEAVAASYAAARPFMAFLCKALDVAF